MCLLALFSHLFMSDFLQPHGLQHARLPCPSPSPRTCSNSCSLSRWYPTISSSVVPFYLQSFPASGSFPVICSHQVATIGDSASASVLPMNIQNWFPLGWTGWISLQSKGLSRILSNTAVQKHQVFGAEPLQSNSHPHITTGKAIALTRRTFVGKGMALLFNMLSRLITPFLPRSKCLNFMAAVTICRDFEAQEKVLSLFPLFTPLFAMRWWDWMPWSGAVLSCCRHVLLLRTMGHSPPGPSVHGIIQARVLEWVATPSFRGSSQPMILGFWMLNFKPAFSLFHLYQEAL